MSTLVLWNAGAGSAQQAGQLRAHLDSQAGIEIHETRNPAEAHALAEQSHHDMVVAAGGDGTINAVVNGLRNNPHPVTLATLPLGTGNNLCRTLEIPLDPSLAWETIRNGVTRDIDVVRMRGGEQATYFINTASGGNSDRVIENLTPDRKEAWGPWCYLRSALPVVADLKGYTLDIEFDHGASERFDVWNVIVANGRTAAGGLPIAPRASLEDGLLDVIVVLDGTPLDTASLTRAFFLGDYLEDDRVLFRRAAHVRLNVLPPLRYLVDGEMVSGNPVEFQAQPRVQRVVVGPDYSAASES